MSFGTSIGDIISLIQLAHQNYRNCKQAGGEYLEIAREVRSLHSVLKSVRDEAENEKSLLFQRDPASISQLASTVEGCKGILEGIDSLLVKYHGLAPDTLETSKSKKLWHRIRFGAELDELGKFRWKIITYTSTLAVLLDSVHLKATDRVEKIAGRVETQVESGFAEVLERLEGFEDMRRAVLYIATKARASQRYNSMESVLSLSTYADDDKEVWRQFRSQLVSLGFRSDSLDRHMEVLKAYMMRLDQTGVLDDAVAQTSTSHQPWCRNASFRLTNLSLLGIDENGSSLANSTEAQTPDSENQTFQKEATLSQPEVAKQDPSNEPEIIKEEIDVQVPQPQTNQVLPTIIVEKILEDESTKMDQHPIGIEKARQLSSSVSPTGRHRIARPAVKGGDDNSHSQRIDQGTILSGIESRTFSQASTAGPDDPPPAYFEGSAVHNTPISWIKDAARKSTADIEFEPEESRLISDGLRRSDRAEVNTKPNIELGKSSTVDDFKSSSYSGPGPPHPYAESYHSATEVTSSQTTLIAPVTEFVESNSNLRVNRSQNRVRPSSWDASDSLGPIGRDASKHAQFQNDGPRDSTLMNHTYNKVGLGRTLDTSRTSEPHQEKGERVEKWLRWAEDIPDKPRGMNRTEESPIRHQESTRSNNYRKTRRSYRGSGSEYRRPRSEDDYSPERLKSRSRRARGNNDSKASAASDKWQQAAKAALLAGATEAFRVRKEPGGWGGEKGKRILTAAIGAGGINAAADRDPDHKSNRHILEAVVGGLAGNHHVNLDRERTRPRSSVDSEESDLGTSDSDDGRGRRRGNSPTVSYGSKPVPTRQT
jgi:hypothetical protein